MAGNNTGIFKPEAKNIDKVFRDADSFYEVPDYQRPYSWVDEHIEELWDDIFDAYEAKDESYFLGPMILVKTQKGTYEVVDGQQRLTTLTILFCVVRDLYGDGLMKLDVGLANSIGDTIKSLVKGQYRLKLVTQLQYQNQFEQEILNGVIFPSTDLSQKEKEQNKFQNAAVIFRDKIADLVKTDKIKGLSNFVDYLLNKVEMVTITCSKQEYAIKLFQILNATGLELSNADLVKSHLLGRLSDETKKKQFVANWNEIAKAADSLDESIGDLLTYYEYYLLARNPKRTLYEELRAEFKSKDPNNVIFDFKKFVSAFDEIKKLQSKLIFSFRYLPNQVFWKAILITAKKEQYSEFASLCKELRKIYYSYWIAGHTTSKLKQISFNLIGWIKAKRSITYIQNEIHKKLLEDKVLEKMKDSLENDAYERAWLKPALILIEYEQTDNAKLVFIDTDRKLHVDHILPQEWESIKYWRTLWETDEAEKWLNRIGNLTLLSGTKNIKASNDAFPKKKSIYNGKGIDGKTAFLTSQDIVNKKDWTKNVVKRRQRWAIGEIAKVLDIDFAQIK